MSHEALFSGKAHYDGLTNQMELISMCPEEFKSEDNPWSSYVHKAFLLGADTSVWKWKTEDREVRRTQIMCLFGLHIAFMCLSDEVEAGKRAVAGWMLSHMLEEVPIYVPN